MTKRKVEANLQMLVFPGSYQNFQNRAVSNQRPVIPPPLMFASWNQHKSTTPVKNTKRRLFQYVSVGFFEGKTQT
jgi:hypothetical protein